MFKPAICILSVVLLACCTTAWAGAGLNKCTDGQQITYTDKPCKKLGLKDAGPIMDTVTIVPAATLESGNPHAESHKESRGHAAGSDKAHENSMGRPTDSQAGKILN